MPHALALASGTAALHLALIVLGIGAGDEVACSSLTFSASANPIRYVGATPVFVDATTETWTMDPELLDRALAERDVKAVVAVDLYGQCCDYDAIREVDDHVVGPPGPVTVEIQEAYLDTVRGRSERWAQWLEYAPAPDRA